MPMKITVKAEQALPFTTKDGISGNERLAVNVDVDVAAYKADPKAFIWADFIKAVRNEFKEKWGVKVIISAADFRRNGEKIETPAGIINAAENHIDISVKASLQPEGYEEKLQQAAEKLKSKRKLEAQITRLEKLVVKLNEKLAAKQELLAAEVTELMSLVQTIQPHAQNRHGIFAKPAAEVCHAEARKVAVDTAIVPSASALVH